MEQDVGFATFMERVTSKAQLKREAVLTTSYVEPGYGRRVYLYFRDTEPASVVRVALLRRSARRLMRGVVRTSAERWEELIDQGLDRINDPARTGTPNLVPGPAALEIATGMLGSLSGVRARALFTGGEPNVAPLAAGHHTLMLRVRGKYACLDVSPAEVRKYRDALLIDECGFLGTRHLNQAWIALASSLPTP